MHINLHINVHILLRCKQILTYYYLLFIEELFSIYAFYHQMVKLVLFI